MTDKTKEEQMAELSVKEAQQRADELQAQYDNAANAQATLPEDPSADPNPSVSADG